MQERIIKKITIDDIAKELGVSKTTVSRAISGKGRIGEETRRRVQDYIEQHNYKPSAMAKGLAKNRTYNIGMVMPHDLFSSDLSFFPGTLEGISEIAAEKEYDVILTLVSNNDLSRLERVLENHKVDGMILMRTLYDDAPAQMLKNSDIPFVSIGLSDDSEIYQVDNDHVEASRELTSILLMKGLKKIAIVTGDMNFVINRKRMQGFYKAHEEMGIPLDRSLIFTDMTSAMLMDRAVDALLLRNINCIIGADDAITGRIMEKLQEEGVYVPEDMRVASFYDNRFFAAAGTGITSLKFDLAELGRETCRVLLRRMRGQQTQQVTYLPYEVVLRESTR